MPRLLQRVGDETCPRFRRRVSDAEFRLGDGDLDDRIHVQHDAAISRSLPGLPVAMTIRSIMLTANAAGQPAIARVLGGILNDEFGECRSLASPSSASNSSATERVPFGGSLYLDKAAGVVHDDVHVRFRLGVLGVVEIEYRLVPRKCRRTRRQSGRAAGL